MILVNFGDLVEELSFAIEQIRSAGDWTICVRWCHEPIGEVALKHKKDRDIGCYVPLIDMKKLKSWVGEITDEALDCPLTVGELAEEIAQDIMCFPVKIHSPGTGTVIKMELICEEDYCS